ncbi:hypothetical protein AB0L40_09655 [Patulibacter sp. NPDC049589]|uniref:hypothetical protein n=1 Tax=Patulibacter sp. NPDC049589 TaxID=3154731 RepID=UPI00343D9291
MAKGAGHECLARLDVWADGVSAGLPSDAAEPLVATHLRGCRDGAEDAQGLLALIADDRTTSD